MSEKENGGPAFPRAETEHRRGQTGMSLRDYFAAKALLALISEPQWGESTSLGFSIGPKTDDQAKNYAVASYVLADAMLEARK